jgi:hypothetical protein
MRRKGGGRGKGWEEENNDEDEKENEEREKRRRREEKRKNKEEEEEEEKKQNCKEKPCLYTAKTSSMSMSQTDSQLPSTEQTSLVRHTTAINSPVL